MMLYWIIGSNSYKSRLHFEHFLFVSYFYLNQMAFQFKRYAWIALQTQMIYGLNKLANREIPMYAASYGILLGTHSFLK